MSGLKVKMMHQNLKTVMNETMSSKFLIIANNIFNEFVKTL